MGSQHAPDRVHEFGLNADRFTTILWLPMKDMAGRGLTLQEYAGRMKARNSAAPNNHWPQIEAIFHRWNIFP